MLQTKTKNQTLYRSALGIAGLLLLVILLENITALIPGRSACRCWQTM